MVPVNEDIRPYLHAFDLRGLLVEGLGWNHDLAAPVHIEADGSHYSLERVAEKSGFVVYVCSPGADGKIPEYPVRRKVERQVPKLTYEHLIIFLDAGLTEQCWQWVKREKGRTPACREQWFRKGQTGEPLLQRLQGIAFGLEEEGDLSIAVVASRVQKAMDVEKVTKRFYERFKEELTAFQGFIDGITEQGDQQWYASLMLNRMMFVYFIQKQGFLDGDHDYLRNRLSRLRSEGAPGRFQQFYRIFLLRLFHEGFGQPEADRAPDLVELLGKVPFLNGGLFDVHDLERDNPDISIPDKAFERVLAFFDSYQWHLDERLRRADNEINPDVLGYIFEKYINQKQMGAYYTKEDITGYISRNTLIPFLFDAARRECPVAFAPGGGVWRLLQDDPDRYIYPSVGHGLAWSCTPDGDDAQPLEGPLDLPDEVAAGVDDVSRRGGWNQPAPSEYALPTETWREVVARRERYTEVRQKLTAGDVSEINDLITLNLDIEQFATDVIAQSEGPELLRAFWHALRDVSVLDPTCGSGAFLFAALNILEPLYMACLEGMQGFLDDLERSDRSRHPETMRDFRDVLRQVREHPSESYFILKSIVLNNLYGVDIMEEAVEICKLRLFLKLVAQLEKYEQIEPLPDIDFNIRAGNTLVGFTSLDAVRDAMTVAPDGQRRVLFEEELVMLDLIEEEAEVASRVFAQFREQQTKLGGEVTAADKDRLRQRLSSLADQLDRYLAIEYRVVPWGTDIDDPDAFDSDEFHEWLESHQPFHWFVEFYGIMSSGGFDVIVGNPPWREYSAAKKDYRVLSYATERCGNLYALCTERSSALCSQGGYFSFIVQLPLVSSPRMAPLRDHLVSSSDRLHYVSFDDRPGKLFGGLQHCRSTIFFARRGSGEDCATFGAPYQRWSSQTRETLFARIGFFALGRLRKHDAPLPKIGCADHDRVMRCLSGHDGKTLGDYLEQSPSEEFVFYQEAMQYWAKGVYGLPYYSKNGEVSAPAHGRYLYTEDSSKAFVVAAILNSSLFYLNFITYSDCFHLNDSLVRGFPVPLSVLSDRRLNRRGEALTRSLRDTSDTKTINSSKGDAISYEEMSGRKAKNAIDEIDRILAEHYGLTDKQVDFVINYDIKHRMG